MLLWWCVTGLSKFESPWLCTRKTFINHTNRGNNSAWIVKRHWFLFGFQKAAVHDVQRHTAFIILQSSSLWTVKEGWQYIRAWRCKSRYVSCLSTFTVLRGPLSALSTSVTNVDHWTKAARTGDASERISLSFFILATRISIYQCCYTVVLLFIFVELYALGDDGKLSKAGTPRSYAVQRFHGNFVAVQKTSKSGWKR